MDRYGSPFYDSLYDFGLSQGTEITSLRVKLKHQLTIMSKEVLYEVFLELKKAYNTLERERFLKILVAYGVGPSAEFLIWQFWARLAMVAWTGRYYGAPFTGSREVTQGGPLSPTVFNMVMDTVIQNWATRVSREDAGPEIFGRVVKNWPLFFTQTKDLWSSRGIPSYSKP